MRSSIWCGPVGLSATLLASLAGAGQIIVIGAPDERLRAAERFGAHAVLPLETTTVEQRKAAIAELTGGRISSVDIATAASEVGKTASFGVRPEGS